MITADELEHAREAYKDADREASDNPMSAALLAKRAGALARYQAREAQWRAVHGAGEPEPIGMTGILCEIAAVGAEKIARAEQAERALPCAAARAQMAEAAGLVEEDAAAQAGEAACRAVGAHRACVYRRAPWCPIQVHEKFLDTVRDHMRDANGPRIYAEERAQVLAHFGLGSDMRAIPRQPLEPHDTYRVARAVAARRPMTIGPSAPGVDSQGRPLVRLEAGVVLTSRERFVVFAGAAGLGKTLAAEFVIAVMGGLLLLSSEIDGLKSEPDLRARVISARCLVIDQFGRAGGKEAVEALIVERDRRNGVTILVCNIASAGEFAQLVRGKYGEPTWDRITGHGVVASFVGQSLRRGAR